MVIILQIEGDANFIAVKSMKGLRHLTSKFFRIFTLKPFDAARAIKIVAFEPLNLNNLGTKICKQLAKQRTRPNPAQLYHPHPAQR